MGVTTHWQRRNVRDGALLSLCAYSDLTLKIIQNPSSLSTYVSLNAKRRNVGWCLCVSLWDSGLAATGMDSRHEKKRRSKAKVNIFWALMYCGTNYNWALALGNLRRVKSKLTVDTKLMVDLSLFFVFFKSQPVLCTWLCFFLLAVSSSLLSAGSSLTWICFVVSLTQCRRVCVECRQRWWMIYHVGRVALYTLV